MSTVTSPLGGLVRAVTVGDGFPCVAVAEGPVVGQRPFRVRGMGIASRPDEARLRAVAEVVERYSAAQWHAAEVVIARARELDGPYVPASSFTAAAAAPPDHESRVRWIQGADLATGTPLWVPAQAVFIRMEPKAGETRGQAPSTGCAAHSKAATALALGLLECIERDATSLMWLTQHTPIRLSLEEGIVGPEALRMAETLSGHDVEPHLFLVPTDVDVPVVYGYGMHGDGGGFVGAAAAADVQTAAVKTLYELYQVHLAIEQAVSAGSTAPATLGEDAEPIDIVLSMADPSQSAAYAFLMNAPQCERVPPGLAQDHVSLVRDLCRRLARRGMSAVGVDITTTEAVCAGLVVMRVLVPEAQPLTLEVGRAYEDSPRAHAYQAWFGLEPTVNPWPNPQG